MAKEEENEMLGDGNFGIEDDVININPLNSEMINRMFEDDDNEEETEQQDDKTENTAKENKTDTEEEPSNSDEENDEGNPESVGDENENGTEEHDEGDDNDNDSPELNISSIASALRSDGLLFDTLSDDELSAIKNPDDFREAVNNHIKNLLDEQQQHIYEALNAGVDTGEVGKYDAAIKESENTILSLNSFTDDAITAETKEAEVLRRNLIYSKYYLKFNGDQEEAKKMTDRSFETGNDDKDALQSLEMLKDYNERRIKALEEQRDAFIEEGKKVQRANAEKLEKSILEGSFFGDVDVDNNTRKRILETATKRRRTKSGKMMTEIEEAYNNDPVEFNRNLNALWVLTDGFKNTDALSKKQANKEIRKQTKALDNLLKRGSFSGGNPSFVSGVSTELGQTSTKSRKRPTFAPDDDL